MSPANQYREYAGERFYDFSSLSKKTRTIINNCNRTEGSPIPSIIIPVINKIRQLQNRSPICQSQVQLRTELDNKKSCYQSIITVTIPKNNNFIQRQMPKEKEIYPFWKFLSFIISGYCYGYCDQFCDWWIWLSGLCMIGCFNCPMISVQLQPTFHYYCQLSDYNYRMISEEIVMIMINQMSQKRQHILHSYFKTLSIGTVWDMSPSPSAQQLSARQPDLTKPQ